MKKKFNYKIARPFVFIKEEGESYSPCLIAYYKTPLEFKNVDRGGGKGETIVSKYRRAIYINLWLIEFKINL